MIKYDYKIYEREKYMKIFISHASQYDYVNKIYEPIKQSEMYKNNEIILPHDENKLLNTKEIIKNCNLMIAEVSLPSTGQGIELAWADLFEIPVLCIYKKGEKISSALKFITNDFIEYDNSDDMINKITNFVEHF